MAKETGTMAFLACGGASDSSWTSPFSSFTSAQSSRQERVRSRTVRSWTCPLPRFKSVFRSGSSDRSSIWQCPRLASAGLAHRRAPPCRECFAEVHGVVSSTVVDLVLLPPWCRQNPSFDSIGWSLSVLHAAQTSVLLSMREQSTEKVCEAASISLNRNTVLGDASALSPSGVRIGASAMTTRDCITEDFKRIADFLDRCASIALDIQKEKGKNQYRLFRVPAFDRR